MERLKPNSITLANSELAPNKSEPAPNRFGASSEPASVIMEFGFYSILSVRLDSSQLFENAGSIIEPLCTFDDEYS